MTEVELVRHELESRMREHADAIDKLTAERERYKTLYMELLERCKLLEKGIIVGKKAERFTAGDRAGTVQKPPAASAPSALPYPAARPNPRFELLKRTRAQ